MRRSKRDRLAVLLSGGGLLRMLETLARRPGLLVLTYHRIGSDVGNPFDDGALSATAEAFRDQVRYVRTHFDVLGQDRLLEAAGRGFALGRASAIITFDDGYRDSFEIAFPILRDLGVPAFFFIPTGYIDRPRLPWWDRIAFILKHTRVDRLCLDLPHYIKIDLRRTGRLRAIMQVVIACREANDFEERAFFDHLESRAEFAANSEALGRELFVTWDEIRRMRASGMAIGSHTHTHPILGSISESDQREELVTSKTRLEEELDEPVKTIAYPVGTRRAFNERTKSLARDTGYEVGFSAYAGINRPGRTDPFDVQRIPVELAETYPLFRTRAIFYNLVGESF
jgi:peptidoglycan/xylan/chitin deacetylase (PgdA/CDA1 family)